MEEEEEGGREVWPGEISGWRLHQDQSVQPPLPPSLLTGAEAGAHQSFSNLRDREGMCGDQWGPVGTSHTHSPSEEKYKTTRSRSPVISPAVSLMDAGTGNDLREEREDDTLGLSVSQSVPATASSPTVCLDEMGSKC